MSKNIFLNRRGFSSILLIILIASLVGGIGYVTLVKKINNVPSISPLSTISPLPTHFSWNGAGFDYPNTWEVKIITYKTPAMEYAGEPGDEIGFEIFKKGHESEFVIGAGGRQGPSTCKEAVELKFKFTKCFDVFLWGSPLRTTSNNLETLKVFDEIVKTIKINIAQLTKEQVLSGFDMYNRQFKNGVAEGGKGSLGNDLSYIGLGFGGSGAGDGMVFADLDGDTILEALVPGRVVRASSGGELYVFKNFKGVARIVDSIGFGKQNGRVVSTNKDTIVVEVEEGMGYPTAQETYKFIGGKLIKQSNTETPTIEKDVTGQPAYLIDAYTKNGKNYIDVDYVEWFHGDAQAKAMQEDGLCPDPKIDYCDFPNGYKRNKNPKIRTFEVGSTIKIEVYGAVGSVLCGYNPQCVKNLFTFKEFRDAVLKFGNAEVLPTPPFHNSKTFIIIDVKDNIVTKITEPYQE